MSVSRTSNKSACIEPSELIINIKFIDIWEDPPGPNGYSGSRHSFYFKICTNGNVIISSNNGLVETERLRVNDNIPIPQFLADVIIGVLYLNVKSGSTTKKNAQAPYVSCVAGDLYLIHLIRIVQIVDLIKCAWKSEKTVQESMMKIKDSDIKILQKSINELQESNKNLSEENIIIANKNEIYEKQINELQESNKNLSEEYLIIANKNEIYEKQINKLQESNKNLSEENIIIANKNDIYKKHLNELQESVEKLYKLLFFLLLILSVVPLICLRYFCE